ncbi:MAG: ABC transporter substrate-binding protein [Eubacteriales bacterium]
MKKSFSKVLALLLVLCMFVPGLAACTFGGGKGTTTTSAGGEYTGGNTLVVGYSTFSQKFSPFFSKTAYDQDVAAMTQVNLLTSDREGAVVLLGKTGETRSFNGTPYDYTGIADCVITQNQDGTVVYAFELRNDVKFSDGVGLTADDVIFSMYALSDPSYDGSSTFYSLPIVGMTEYRTGVNADIYAKYAAIADAIIEAGIDEVSTEEGVTAALTEAFWTTALDAGGLKFAQEIMDYCIAKYAAYFSDVNNNEVALGMYVWGFGEPSEDGTKFIGASGTEYDYDTLSLEDYWFELTEAYADEEGVVDYATMNQIESAGTSLYDFAKEAFISIEGPKDPAAGGAITSIAGIAKTGQYSLTVTMTQFDAVAIYQLGVTVAPLHYYGDTTKYNYSNDQFGFDKGDLSVVKAKTTTPMGAGAYKFVNFTNGIVNFERNTQYYKGTPKITYIKFQEITSEADKVTAMVTGTVDITDPTVSTSVIDAIKDANGAGQLTGSAITYNAVDNLGYGYIGINADNVKVGTDKASEASKNLRKAFATIFSVYRDTVINSYYGDRATVIQYPISNTSWAAPRPSDNDYAIAYSKDVDGQPIYTNGMTAAQKYAAALQAAIGFLQAAGYTWDAGTQQFTAAPEGAELAYEFIIPATGTGDHPAYGILTSAQEALASIGITLSINDPTDSNVLWDSLESGTCAMWAAAWEATPDPDMYQVYHSSNIVGLHGTDSNHYAISDSTLDTLIMDARNSDDRSYRKGLYKECLEILLDWGVEVPTYQRQNCVIFSTQRVEIDTLTPDITTFWDWMNDIENLEMK